MRTGMKSLSALATVIAAGTALVSVAYAQSPSLNVSDQKLARNTVTIADVNLAKNGFIAIHASDANGKMTNKVIGYAAIGAGDHKDVKVDLTGTHKAGETLWVVAHQTKGRLLFGTRGKGNIGAPVMQDGKIVDEPFKTL